MAAFWRSFTVAIVLALTSPVAVAQALTDTALRAAFCLGARDEMIAWSYPKTPLFITPDGRGYTPPDVERRMRDDEAAARREWQRLPRFLLSFMVDTNNILPMSVATTEGRRVAKECISGLVEGCVRLRPCSNLNWLPY